MKIMPCIDLTTSLRRCSTDNKGSIKMKTIAQLTIVILLWKENYIKQCGQFGKFQKEAVYSVKDGWEVGVENVKKTYPIEGEEALPQAFGAYEFGVMSIETQVGIKEAKCNLCGFAQIVWIIHGK